MISEFTNATAPVNMPVANLQKTVEIILDKLTQLFTEHYYRFELASPLSRNDIRNKYFYFLELKKNYMTDVHLARLKKMKEDPQQKTFASIVNIVEQTLNTTYQTSNKIELNALAYLTKCQDTEEIAKMYFHPSAQLTRFACVPLQDLSCVESIALEPICQAIENIREQTFSSEKATLHESKEVGNPSWKNLNVYETMDHDPVGKILGHLQKASEKELMQEEDEEEYIPPEEPDEVKLSLLNLSHVPAGISIDFFKQTVETLVSKIREVLKGDPDQELPIEYPLKAKSTATAYFLTTKNHYLTSARAQQVKEMKGGPHGDFFSGIIKEVERKLNTGNSDTLPHQRYLLNLFHLFRNCTITEIDEFFLNASKTKHLSKLRLQNLEWIETIALDVVSKAIEDLKQLPLLSQKEVKNANR